MTASETRWVVAAMVLILVPSSGAAHGTDLVATVTRRMEVELSVVVEATYHSGRPLAGAQVTVHAPGGPEAPWLAGACDEEGRFQFTPPADRPGVWEVRVVHHGHGGRVAVELPATTEGTGGPAVVRAEASSAPHLTALQMTVTGACVVWGLVGTALFFSRRHG